MTSPTSQLSGSLTTAEGTAIEGLKTGDDSKRGNGPLAAIRLAEFLTLHNIPLELPICARPWTLQSAKAQH